MKIDNAIQGKMEERARKYYESAKQEWLYLNNTFLFNEPCSRCRQKGQIICNICKGHGEVRCGQCGGSGKTNCISCGGSGRIPCSCGTGFVSIFYHDNYGYEREKIERCQSCGGLGYHRCGSCIGFGKETCFSCGGSGKDSCSNCKGSGVVGCPDCNGKKFITHIRTPGVAMWEDISKQQRDFTTSLDRWMPLCCEKTQENIFTTIFHQILCFTDITLATPVGDRTIKFIDGSMVSGLDEAISAYVAIPIKDLHKQLSRIWTISGNAIGKINDIRLKAFLIPYVKEILEGKKGANNIERKFKKTFFRKTNKLLRQPWCFNSLLALIATMLISPLTPWTQHCYELILEEGGTPDHFYLISLAIAALIWIIAGFFSRMKSLHIYNSLQFDIFKRSCIWIKKSTALLFACFGIVEIVLLGNFWKIGTKILILIAPYLIKALDGLILLLNNIL